MGLWVRKFKSLPDDYLHITNRFSGNQYIKQNFLPSLLQLPKTSIHTNDIYKEQLSYLFHFINSYRFLVKIH